MQARLQPQVAAWLSIVSDAEVGASHGLGYILGAVRGPQDLVETLGCAL